ncbi:MAG: Gfo/Idh/MocA family protein [Candidatus Krumholzibacteriia bacterium]
MPDKFRVAVIGTGRIAQTHLQACGAVEGIEVAAVADTDAEVARSAAEAHGARAYVGHAALLTAEKKLDAAIVCTPPAHHPGIVLDCLGAGLHVLVEKPVAIAAADVRRMLAAAESGERVLMMASKFRYTEDMISARALIRAGILGTVVHFENTFASWLDVSKRWNADPAVSGGGVLIDNGTHSMDVARYLLGPITEVNAWRGRQVQAIPVEDTAHVSLRTSDGVTGTIDLSWSITKERESYVDVYGTEGMLSVGWRGSRYRQNRATAWVPFGKGYDKLGAFTAQLRDLVACARGRATPLITGEDALASVLAMEAAYASVAAGCWKPVPAV